MAGSPVGSSVTRAQAAVFMDLYGSMTARNGSAK